VHEVVILKTSSSLSIRVIVETVLGASSLCITIFRIVAVKTMIAMIAERWKQTERCPHYEYTVGKCRRRSCCWSDIASKAELHPGQCAAGRASSFCHVMQEDLALA